MRFLGIGMAELELKSSVKPESEFLKVCDGYTKTVCDAGQGE